MFDRIRFWLRAVFRPSSLEREMQEEMQTHLDRRVEVLVAGGMIMTISSDLARELWGSADPIGRRLVQTSAGIGLNRVFTVTGVFDTRYLFKGGGGARVYRPTSAWWPSRYLIRTVGQASELAAAVRRVVREELPMTSIGQLTTLAEVEAEASKERRMVEASVIASGVIVLVLASLGLYGVVALAVAQRRREIGVRMALGARAEQVVQLFYVKGVKLGILGLSLGLPLSLGAVRVLDNRTAQVSNEQSPSVWLVGGIIAVVVLVVASIVTLLPATGAATVDPLPRCEANSRIWKNRPLRSPVT